jgi:transposase
VRTPIGVFYSGRFECEPLTDELHGFGQCRGAESEGALDEVHLTANVAGDVEDRRLIFAEHAYYLEAKVSFYGLYLYNEGQVRIWPYPRASSAYTVNVLRRLRETIPAGRLVVIWDGAPYHRDGTVQAATARLNITTVPLPGYSPDLMPVEPLWRWLREDVTYQHFHATADDLIRRVAAFEDRVNACRYLVADRLWVKDQLDPAEENVGSRSRWGLVIVFFQYPNS